VVTILAVTILVVTILVVTIRVVTIRVATIPVDYHCQGLVVTGGHGHGVAVTVLMPDSCGVLAGMPAAPAAAFPRVLSFRAFRIAYRHRDYYTVLVRSSGF
jgi:hypothetical protein